MSLRDRVFDNRLPNNGECCLTKGDTQTKQDHRGCPKTEKDTLETEETSTQQKETEKHNGQQRVSA